jgi:Na+-translocating ferredoxin:NAD+ oxidoreductase RnfG subunit
MRRSASSSDPRRLLAALVTAGMAAATTGNAAAAVLRTQDEALHDAFPSAVVERETRFLDDAQAKRIEEEGVKLGSRVVIRYVGARAGERVGVAYFDTHVVRTLAETILVLVDPQGTVARIEILSFEEPPDYLPREKWLDQFDGAVLSDELSLKRGIRAIAGATLSSRAVTDAVRRVLAIDRELRAAAPEPPAGSPGKATP